jgi:hypothetical protein
VILNTITNKELNKLQCYVVIDLRKLFWYLIHVVQIIRNGNSISVYAPENYYYNVQRSFLVFSVKFGICVVIFNIVEQT